MISRKSIYLVGNQAKVDCACCSNPVTIYQGNLSDFTKSLDKYYKGGLAQDVFPYMSSGLRELLISGICPKCWDAMF